LKRLKRLSKLISVSASFLLILYLHTSCASLPVRDSLTGVSIVGQASDVFVFVPIKHNRLLLSRILPKAKYVQKALDRTEYIYMSVKVKHQGLDELEDGGGEPGDISEIADDERLSNTEDIFKLLSYDVCALGRYPKSIAALVFKKRDGWQKQKAASSGYKYYKRLDAVDARGVPSFSFCSIPESNLALFSYNERNESKMEKLLQSVSSPRKVSFGDEFAQAIKQAKTSHEICIYVANPHFFLSNLLALELDLPIENLRIYLRRNAEKAKEFYNYKLILQMRNETAGFATRLLLSKLLKTQARIEGENIIVEKSKLGLDRLVDIINKVLNRQ